MDENIKNNSIEIIEMKATYSQEQDSCSSEPFGNYLQIETQDGGGGIYYVIKTERWAFDDIDELIVTLEDFKKRIKPK